MKVKAKEKSGIVKVKVLAKPQNIGPEEGEKKKKEPNFITSVVAKVGDAVVYDLNGSGFMSKDPLFKFKFKGKKGDELEVTWTDLKGETKTKKAKIK
jgi:sulfur-oxidizing protein SoxZ